MTRRIPGHWQVYLGPGLVFMLALAMRVWFIMDSSVENPLRRSDALAYLTYALNLVHSQTFSSSDPSDPVVVPDSFRDPGYPTYLALLMVFLGFSQTWYVVVLLTQGVLGALTASLTCVVGRRWLPGGWAAATGVVVALWPHNVVISGFVLSETLFGFLVIVAIWLSSCALESGSRKRWLGAGLAFGAAAMVNATITPFACLLALFLWKRRITAASLALALALGSLALPAAWAARGWSVDTDKSSAGRAMQNLVQGSWPEYHRAYIGSLQHDPEAQGIMEAINAEQQLALRSRVAGLQAIVSRVGAEPSHYLAWYAWKPALLWAWSIRVGWGDIYPYPVKHSIYLTNPVMPVLEALFFALNPVLFVLMGIAAIALLRPAAVTASPGLLIIALLVVFETLVYGLLQSEPRYSIPFRPLEMILAATAVWWIVQWRQRRTVTDTSRHSTELVPPTLDHPSTAPDDPVQRGVT